MATLVDSRLVLRYEDGAMSFRNIGLGATYAELFGLANAINSLQECEAKQVLYVTVRQFGGGA